MSCNSSRIILIITKFKEYEKIKSSESPVVDEQFTYGQHVFKTIFSFSTWHSFSAIHYGMIASNTSDRIRLEAITALRIWDGKRENPTPKRCLYNSNLLLR